jgi:hypothetical protein
MGDFTPMKKYTEDIAPKLKSMGDFAPMTLATRNIVFMKSTA